MQTKRIAIFASGTGSNAVNLIRSFEKDSAIDVAFVLSNKSDAKVLESAKSLGVQTFFYNNSEVSDGDFLVDLCTKHNIDWIILAGYLRLIPHELIQTFEGKIINLHPSLLPKYGGKGMHGRNVHRAVIDNKESSSGISIHYVNEEFDKGELIAQFRCTVDSNETVESLESKIRYLEQTYLPMVIRGTILH